jgi:ubiquinone/menaquinone biosynthesis C-methylase UbiE
MANPSSKPYKGWAMEGFIAGWYARQTARDIEEIRQLAQRIAAQLNSGSRVLEIAPGPGYLAIELARVSGAFITGLDISRSFVRIARDNAGKAGVRVDFEHGDAADLPFPDTQFDLIVCRAAFKNFSRPLVALNEMHRVLKPGGNALIIDLRKDFSQRALKDYARGSGLLAGSLVRLVFNTMLKKRAYTKENITDLVAQSRFGQGEIRIDPIGFELRLHK